MKSYCYDYINHNAFCSICLSEIIKNPMTYVSNIHFIFLPMKVSYVISVLVVKNIDIYV